MKIRDLEFFLSHTVQHGSCLEWTRCFNTDGYPRCGWKGSSNGKVHRIVWELYNGRSSEGLVIRHRCDNPRCINPRHLEDGTPADNVRDRDERQRHGKAKLSHEEVRKIRELYLTGNYLQKELGEMFGIHKNTVSSLINFTHWKTV